ncbi:alpha/beta hydrolase [Nocardioides sp. Bht2]|uniref:alpha/beta hydrolase n=1 Tax=Nocardioides sp. Bht2 TaxID=3392297 RepID=UPI0039B66F71
MSTAASVVATTRAAQRIVERGTVRALLSLPDRAKRALAGAPVVLDGQTLDVSTQLVLRLQKVSRKKGAEEFPIPEGREVLAEQSALLKGEFALGAVSDTEAGGVGVRVYVPRELVPSRQRPTLIFIHGGGFIYGAEHSTHDSVCQFLAQRAGVQVISIDYRLAPEAAFPAAYDDSLAAFRAIVEASQEWRVDTDRIAVGGDSAGGNLAAAVALAAAREGLPLAFQLLIYPVTDALTRHRSRDLFGQGFFLTDGFMDMAIDSYLPDHALRSDPRVHLIEAEIPDGVAPALLVTAGFDPLRDEGEAYARRLVDAGVEVELRRETGLIHGFLNWVGVPCAARDAVTVMAEQLAAALKR